MRVQVLLVRLPSGRDALAIQLIPEPSTDNGFGQVGTLRRYRDGSMVWDRFVPLVPALRPDEVGSADSIPVVHLKGVGTGIQDYGVTLYDTIPPPPPFLLDVHDVEEGDYELQIGSVREKVTIRHPPYPPASPLSPQP